MLDLKLLRTFREVATRGSFSAAADALSFTQPAVSQHVAKLERGLSVQLLRRDGRTVRLTPAGETLLEHAELLFDGVRRAELEVLAAAGRERPRLRVGAFPTAASGLMPEALKGLRESHPAVEIDLRVIEPEPAVEELTAGRLDIALFTDSELEPVAQRPGIVYERICDDPMLAALPIDHPLAREPVIPLERLADEVWFTPCTSGSCPDTNIILHACANAGVGFTPDVRLSSDDYQAVQGMVASGMGVALVPALAGAAVRHDLVVRPLAGDPPTRRVHAVLPAGTRDPVVERLIEALRMAARVTPGLPGPRLIAA